MHENAMAGFVAEMAAESTLELPKPDDAQQHSTEKYHVTVFVSNLDFKLGEDRIREIFSKVRSRIENQTTFQRSEGNFLVVTKVTAVIGRASAT